jgi:hypothetical protein
MHWGPWGGPSLREDDLRLLLTSGRIQCLQAPRPRKLGRPDFRLGRRRPTLIHPLNCSTATAAAKRTCHSHIACIPEGLGVQQTEHSCPPFLVESEQPFLVFDETQVPGLTLPSPSIDVASRPTVPPVHPSVTLARCQLSFWHVLGMIKSKAPSFQSNIHEPLRPRNFNSSIGLRSIESRPFCRNSESSLTTPPCPLFFICQTSARPENFLLYNHISSSTRCPRSCLHPKRHGLVTLSV